MRCHRSDVACGALTALASSALHAAPPARDIIAAAIADPARPDEQVQRDAARKPAEVLAFSGLKPGDRIADFMSGSAYYTRLFSRVVGPRGHVYALLPEEELKNCPPAETAGTRAIEHDARYANVSIFVAPVNTLHAPAALDVIFTSLNFHDLFDPFMGPANVPSVTRTFFDTLKPGDTLVIIDHAAQAGS